MRSLDATLDVPKPHIGVATGCSSFASCPCAGLPAWIARELAALAFAHTPVTAAWRHGVNTTLPSSLHRSAPAQPPAEGTEGAAPGGGPPGPPPNMTSNRRLQQTQAQVEEVVDIMRVNVDKVLERDQKLSELDDRADALQAGASQFESSAAKLKRKYWWKNCKMMIMLGAICAIIVVVIVSKYR